jgi:hypothetical protein
VPLMFPGNCGTGGVCLELRHGRGIPGPA